jgi:beta-phosphoglucomutase
MTNNKHFAALFDMDGVIVDNKEFHVKAWLKFSSRHERAMSEEEVIGNFGRTNSDYLKLIFGSELTESEIAQYEDEKESIYREIYEASIHPTNGLIELLDKLAGDKVAIALGTSAPAKNVEFVLNKTATSKYFQQIVDASNVKHGKPNPEIYLKASEKLQIKPSSCIVFEDSIFGIQAGKRAGMKVVAITTTHQRNELLEADLIVDSFKELDMQILCNLVNEKANAN